MKSMTGFAQGRFAFNNISLHIAFRSWNHRYLEFSYKGTGITPESEKLLKEIVKDRIFRGKIEIVYDIFISGRDRYNIQVNERLLTDILDELIEIRRKYKEVQLSMDSLLKIPMVFRVDYTADIFSEKDLADIRAAVEKVFNDFLESRTVEGSAILEDLQTSIRKIEACLKLVKEKADLAEKEIFCKYKEKLTKFLGETDIDERRILQETAILAEKSCINEEIQRLDAHTRRLHSLITDPNVEIKGREADFLSQEMLRETHTISSKTSSLDIHDHVLEIRREIEKIKQQVQNVE